MQKEHKTQETTIQTEVKIEQPTMGGLSLRSDLRGGISIEDIQGQVSGWWDDLSSSLSLPGADAASGE